MNGQTTRYQVSVDGREYEVSVDEQGGTVTVDGDLVDMDLTPIGDDEYSVLVDRRSATVAVESTGDGGSFRVGDGRRAWDMRVRDERRGRSGAGDHLEHDGDGQVVRASMPGIVAQLVVDHGEVVEVDQPLLILEAMKMENEICAAVPGRVSEVHVAVGQPVAKGDLLVVIEPVED